MDARAVRGALVAALIGCCCLVWASAFAQVAQAEPVPYEPPSEAVTDPAPSKPLADCPPSVLEAFEGEDAAAGETRLLRQDLGSACAALSDRLDDTRKRLFWLAAEARRADGQRQVTNERLDDLVEQLEGPVPVSVAGQPVEVVDAAGEQYSDDLATAVDASGAATKESLWFIAGLAVALFAGYALYRQVMPRG